MKRLLLCCLLLGGALFSCSKEETGGTPDKVEISLSTLTFQLSRDGSATADITVTPSTTPLEEKDFRLENPDQEMVSIHYTSRIEQTGEGLFRLTILDSGGEESYDETPRLYCDKAGFVSEPLHVSRGAFAIPVVRVTTEGPVLDKETWVAGTIEIDGKGYLPSLERMAVEVKGRGNTTWGWEKKPYALKLDSKKEVLGMPKHKRWCLIANYMDRTNLRNRVAYHIGANSRLAWTTRNEFVELYFNGSYDGLYLLTEQIKVDKNRVNVTEMEPTDNSGEAVTGGYLLEFDTNYDEEQRFRSATTDIPVNIKYPDPEDLTPEQFAYIRDYVNRIDEVVAAQSMNQGSDDDAPFEYLDMESLADFWICFEVTANHEMLHPKSIYFYKERSGKLFAGPIWDFDYETLVSHTATRWVNYGMAYPSSIYPWHERNWWNMLLLHNATFRRAVKSRWQEWYPFLQRVPDFIEHERKAIAQAEVRNRERWPSINDTGYPNGDEWLSFDEAVDRLKEVYTTRTEWLNSQISAW